MVCEGSSPTFLAHYRLGSLATHRVNWFIVSDVGVPSTRDTRAQGADSIGAL